MVWPSEGEEFVFASVDRKIEDALRASPLSGYGDRQP